MSSMILGLLLSSCKDDDNTSREYNPNEEVVLTSFNPTKGPLASQVIYMVATLAIIKKLWKCFLMRKKLMLCQQLEIRFWYWLHVFQEKNVCQSTSGRAGAHL